MVKFNYDRYIIKKIVLKLLFNKNIVNAKYSINYKNYR